MENTKPQEQEKDPKTQQAPNADKHSDNNLDKKDIPDSTNESTGVPGSGQRQDSN